MGEYSIVRIATGKDVEGTIDTLSVTQFIQQLREQWQIVEVQPTTDPRNPITLYWKITIGAEVITGRLRRSWYNVRFQSSLPIAIQFARWYRALVPGHIRLSFTQLDNPAQPWLELTEQTTDRDFQTALSHHLSDPQYPAVTPVWRLMFGGYLGRFAATSPEKAYAAVLRVFAAPDETLWASGSEDIGTAMYQHDRWRRALGSTTSDFAWFQDHLWATGEADHLLWYDTERWHPVQVPFAWSRILRVDSANHLWIAPTEGLWRTADGQHWESLSLPWSKPFIRKIWSDTANAMWIVVQGQQALYHWREGVIDAIALPRKAFKAEKVTALTTDAVGQLWVGTQTAGLWLWDGHTWEHMPIAQHYQEAGLIGPTVRDVCVDHQQRVWVATGHGVTCLMDGVWRTIIVGLEPPSHEQVIPIWPVDSWTSCLNLDKAGRLWLGTSDGQVAWINTLQAPYENPIDELLVEQLAEFIELVE